MDMHWLESKTASRSGGQSRCNTIKKEFIITEYRSATLFREGVTINNIQSMHNISVVYYCICNSLVCGIRKGKITCYFTQKEKREKR